MTSNENSTSLSIERRHAVASPESAVPAVWHIGDVILNLYEVKDVFWLGAKGLVYRVRHREWNIDLAVKSPRETPFESEKETKDFIEAADGWIALGLFPHIVSCYYVRMLGGIPRLFLEFVEGNSLHDWIRTRKLYEGGKQESLKRILDIAIQFAWGLKHAHEHNLSHPDLKLSDVLLTADGIVKLKGFASPRNSRHVSDPAAFLPSEQPSSQELFRQRDIWSWAGSVLDMFSGESDLRYELIDGARDYVERGVQDDYIPAIPASLALLFGQCLQSDPAQCRPSMAEVAESLRQIYKEETGSDHPRPLPIQVNTRAEDLNNRALSALDFGNTDEALWLLDEALILKPQYAEATYNRSLVRWRSGRITDDDLITTLNGLKHSGVDDEFVNYLIGRVHLERDDAHAAAEILARIDRGDAHAEQVSEALVIAQNKGLQSENQLTAFCDDEIYGPNLFSPDGKSLLLTVSGPQGSGPQGPRIRILDFTDPRSARYLEGHEMLIHAITLSADGRYALSSSEDATIRLWDVLTTECLQILRYEGWPYPNLLALNTDARRAVLGYQWLTDEATLKVWDVKAGHGLRDFEMPMTYGVPASIYSVSMSPDGKYVLSGGEAGAVSLWDVDTGKMVRTFEGLWGYIRFVQFSPDGTQLFAANSCEVRQFDVNTGECLRALKVEESDYDKFALITVSADGSYALYGSDLAELRLWEIKTGRCVRTFQDLAKDVRYAFGGSYEAFTSLNLSVDGEYLLTGTRGGTYKLRRFDPHYSAPLMLSRITPTEQAIENQIAAEESLALARKALAEKRFIAAANHMRTVRSLPGYERSPEAVELWTSLYAHLPRTRLTASWPSHEVTAPELPRSISISGDGKYVLFGSYPMEVKEVATENRSPAFERAVGGKVALSWDGRLAMAGGYDGFALWDAVSGKLIDQLYRSHEKDVDDLQFSADGTRAVSCSEDAVHIWKIDADGLRCLHWIAAEWGQQSAVAISSDNKYCIAGVGFSSFRDNDYRLRLWEVDSRECRIIDGYDSGIYTLVFTPDNQRFLGGGFDGKLRLWDVATGECVRLFEGHTVAVDSVDISADGRFAISGGRDHTMRLWELATGECLRIWEIKTDLITPVRFSSDCKHVLAGTREHTVRVELLDWELEDREPADWDEGAKPFIETFLMRRAGKSNRKIPAWSDADFEALLRDLGCAGYGWLRPEGVGRELEKQAAEMAPEYAASRVRFNQVADAGYGLIHDERASPFWITNPALESGPIAEASWAKLYAETPQKSVSSVVGHNWIHVSPNWSDPESIDRTFDQPVAFSRNHELVASCFNRMLRVWDSRQGHTVRDLIGFADRLECASFSNDGTLIATGAVKDSIKVWAVAGEWIATFPTDNSRHEAICFKQNGKLLASGDWNGSVKVWSIKANKLFRVFSGHEDSITTLGFSPVGELLASGSWDGTVKLWDLETGECLKTLAGHTPAVGIVCFTPDGNFVATSTRDKYGDRDHVIYLWDVESGRCIRSFHGHDGSILSVEFSRTGPYLVSAGADATVRLWDVRTAECLSVMDATMGDAGRSSTSLAHRVGFALDGQNILYCRGQRDWVERTVWTVDWE